jgi:selenide, water dikinase
MILGFETGDDASVVRIAEDRALVSSVDLFTPIVDDPYTFGQIAAANSLSDLYAMGAEPLSGLCVLCYSPKLFSPEIPAAILQGAMDKGAEGGAVIAGGHTVKSEETLFGLAVTGLAHPDRLLRNNGGKAGDILYLSKPIGTGLLATAYKRDLLDDDGVAELIRWTTTLNKSPMEAALACGATGATDITGFGLLLHLAEMTNGDLSVEIDAGTIPVLDAAEDLAARDVVPGGTRANLDHAAQTTRFPESLDEASRIILADAQTSGGLVVAVPADRAIRFEDEMADRDAACWRIGRLVPRGSHSVMVVNP